MLKRASTQLVASVVTFLVVFGVVVGASQASKPVSRAAEEPAAVTASVELECAAAARSFGSDLRLLAGEHAAAAAVSDWERFRGGSAGAVVGDVPADAFAKRDQMTVCVFAADELTPPIPQGATPPDTLVISIGPDKSVTQEIVGVLEAIMFLMPSDLEASGLLPGFRAAASSNGSFSSLTYHELSIVGGDPVRIVVGAYPEGFCVGVTEPTYCVDRATMDGIGPTFAIHEESIEALLIFTRPDVETIEVHLSTDGTIALDATAWPTLVQALGRRVGATHVPTGIDVIGTSAYNIEGSPLR